jgi:hypothetical protein
MKQNIESTPRLDAARASDLVAQYLRVPGRTGAQEILDYPGTALESLLEHEIKELQKTPPRRSSTTGEPYTTPGLAATLWLGPRLSR